MDWWGNPCAVDTSEMDELRYWTIRQLMLAEVEVVDSDGASWDSVINGGTGTFALKGV